jgi:hypothetical protein
VPAHAISRLRAMTLASALVLSLSVGVGSAILLPPGVAVMVVAAFEVLTLIVAGVPVVIGSRNQ